MVSLLYGGQALALPTEWSVYSPSLGRAQQVSNGHPSRDKVRLMAEFPQIAGGGRWTDSNLVHVFPEKAYATYDVTSLNNPKQFCPRVGTLFTRINKTEDGVMDILSTGLDQAREIGRLIDDLDAFKTANGSAFQIVSRVQAETSGLNQQIATYNDSIATLESVITGLQSQVAALTTSRDAALAEADHGLPPNDATIAALQVEKGTLEQEIANLNMIISSIEQAGVDASVFKAQRTQKQARLNQIPGLIEEAAAPYRAQKKAEADNLQTQINTVQATITSKQTEAAGYRQIVVDKRLEIVNKLTVPEYINAQGTLGQYSAMLRQYTQLNEEFRSYRRPIIEDAMLVLNFAKLNFNDLATFDAGYGGGVLPIWDDSALQLPGYLANALSNQSETVSTPYGRFTRKLPAVNAQLGTLYDVSFSTREGTILSSPPFKFSTYRIKDGNVTAITGMSIAEEGSEEEYPGFTHLKVILGANSKKTVVASDYLVNKQGNEASAVNPKETLQSTGDNPQAEVTMGLGTYCGNIEAQSSEVTRSGDSGFFVAFERTNYVYTPRTSSEFPVLGTVHYKIAAQGAPHTAQCEFHVEDYYTASRNWGRSSFNFLGLIRRESRWDNRHIEDLKQQGFFCTFVSPGSESDPQRKKEVDALNELALAETYGRFVMTTAKQWHPEEVSPAEIDAFKESHPRYTWSPALQALCGGNPICNVVIEAFNNVEDIAATGATSIRTTGRLDLTMKTQRSWATTLPGVVDSRLSFRVQ